MVSSKPWYPLIYDTKFIIDKHLLSLLAIQGVTHKDMYNKEANIVFSAEVDGAGDIIVTMVDD